MFIDNVLSEKNYLEKDASTNPLIIFLHTAMTILAIIVIAWFNNGLFTFITPYIPNYVRYGIYFTWLVLALITKKRYVTILVLQMWPLLLFFFYLVFLSFFVEMNLKVYIMSITYLIIIYSIYLYYINVKNRQIQKILCEFIIIDYIIIGTNTFFHLKSNPMIARYLSTGIETIKRLLGDTPYYGVASYGYFYALVSIIILLGFIFLNFRKESLLAIIAIIPATALLIRSGFTIAIIFTLIFLILITMLRYNNKYTFALIVFLGTISLLIFQGLFAVLFTWCAGLDWIPNPVSVRLNELAYFFSGYDIFGTDLYIRLLLYLKSLEAFLHNIIAGISVSTNGIYSPGGHSAWLDLMATFGLLAIPFFIFLYKAYKYGKKRTPIHFKPLYKIYWLYFICLGFVNTILFAPIYTIWFLFLPLFINNYYNKEKRIYNTGQNSMTKGEISYENSLAD